MNEAAQVLEELPDGVGAPSASLFTRAARARLYQAGEQREAAITELVALGEDARRSDINNPGFVPWRSQLAHLVAAVEPRRALELAESELTDARRVSMPSAIGVALRARAACEHDGAREVTLREAVAALEQSPVRLELTRALIDLGGHLRRSGRRRDARHPLRQALELAHRCAAEPLIAIATDELHAADGRPRSPWLTGAAALTPSELRVARLAASGLTNQQVAEALFITLKTVEMHLTNTYRKLGSNSRADLPRLLGTEPPGD
jgi:DNA-binding CsgD family transcriptional regulator